VLPDRRPTGKSSCKSSRSRRRLEAGQAEEGWGVARMIAVACLYGGLVVHACIHAHVAAGARTTHTCVGTTRRALALCNAKHRYDIPLSECASLIEMMHTVYAHSILPMRELRRGRYVRSPTMITHQKYATHIFLVLSHLPAVNMHINPLDRHQRHSTARRATVIDFRSGSRWRWITDMDGEGGEEGEGT
jgi:hypothetical protein